MSIVTVSAENTSVPGTSSSLVAVARRFCRSHQIPASELIAGVACSEHWEEARLRDAAFAAENDLPVEPPAHDPWFIDEVAVERARRGERVVLTPAERAEARRSHPAPDVTWAAMRAVLNRRKQKLFVNDVITFNDDLAALAHVVGVVA